MRAFRLSTLVLGGLLVVAAQADVPVQFFDRQGYRLTDLSLSAVVKSEAGETRAKVQLPARADGVYSVPAGPGDSVQFCVDDGAGASLGSATAAIKIGEASPTPISIVITPQGVANDDCMNAQPVAIGSVTNDTTVSATVDGAPMCGTSNTAPGVWFSVVGDGTTLTASTCETIGNPPGSASYDTKISVYCGSGSIGCGQPGCLLFCIGGNDDAPGCNFHSAFSWCSVAGNSYRILVHGFNAATGNFGLSVSSSGQNCTSGIACQSPPPQGACCLESECPYSQGETPVQCTLALEDECTAAGGTFHLCEDCVVPVNQIDLVDQANVAIPSSFPAGLNRTLVVPTSAIIVDLNVDIGINHTWVSDLRITLHGPTGVSQVLWNHVCGASDNILATADDEGTETICASIGAGPIDSVFFSPAAAGDGPLTVFDGTDAAGSWTLNVADDFASDVGILQQWSLHFIEGAPLCDAVPCPQADTGGGTGCDEDEEDDEGGDPRTAIEDEAKAPPPAPVGMARVP